MPDSDRTYVAVDPKCRHVVGAAVDRIEHLTTTAQYVERWRKAGYEVSVVTAAEARAMQWCGCDRRKHKGKLGQPALRGV